MTRFPRRTMIAVGVLAALGGTLLRLIHPFGRHHRLTPYDDLIARLTDRDAGTLLGRAVLARDPGFEITGAAAQLRAAFKTASLAVLAQADITAGRMNVEAGGWVIPETLALLCAVAAKA